MNSQKVFIFDFDGTIADTHHYICEIANRMSEEFQYDMINMEDLEKLKNMSAQEIIRYLKVPVLKIPAILAKGKKEFQSEVTSIKPFQGLSEVLNQLKEIGINIGILSSNSYDNIINFLTKHNLDIFDFVHSTARVLSKNASLKKFMEKTGLDPEHIFYIGDEIRDIIAARRLGIKVAAVTWGYNSAEALSRHDPDFLIDNPWQLLNID